MTDPVPSKEQSCAHFQCVGPGSYLPTQPMHVMWQGCPWCENEHLRRENVRWENAHKILLAENERLRKQVGELSVHAEKWVKRALTPAHEREMPHCSTCSCPPYPAPEPGEVATDAERWRTYLKCYDQEGMVAAEWGGPAAITAFIDSQRATQPPGAGQ